MTRQHHPPHTRSSASGSPRFHNPSTLLQHTDWPVSSHPGIPLAASGTAAGLTGKSRLPRDYRCPRRRSARHSRCPSRHRPRHRPSLARRCRPRSLLPDRPIAQTPRKPRPHTWSPSLRSPRPRSRHSRCPAHHIRSPGPRCSPRYSSRRTPHRIPATRHPDTAHRTCSCQRTPLSAAHR